MLSNEKQTKVLKFFSKLKSITEKEGINLHPSQINIEIINHRGSEYIRIKSQKPFEEGDLEKSSKYTSIMKSLYEPSESFPEDFEEDIDLESLQPHLNINDKYIPVTFKNLYTGELQTIEHIPGEILIIDFWATWCGPCIGAMKHNYEIISKNLEKWGGKVKFITASLVEEVEEVKEFILGKEWNKYENVISHFINTKIEQKDFATLYGVKFIPHVVIVDKKGVIKFLGSPNGAKFEEKINEILNQEEGLVENLQNLDLGQTHQTNLISKEMSETLSTLKEIFESFKTLFKSKNLPYEGSLDFNFRLNAKLNENWDEILIQNPEEVKLEVQLRKPEYDNFMTAFLQKFPDYLNISWLKTKFTLLETFDITPQKNCSKCNKDLPLDKGIYHCQWCNVSFCEDCTENLNDEVGRAKLVHQEHNLLYFITREGGNLQNLDSYKLGKNLFKDAPDEELDVNHQACCNGCSQGFHNIARYICISCRPGALRGDGFSDYCYNCIKILRNPDHEKYENVKGTTLDHDHNTHVYLRLVFNVEDYYTY